MAGHAMLASATKLPCLALEQSEADVLAKAAVTVADLYPTVVMTPQTMAWMGLAMAMSTVYGPRLFLIRLQVAEARAARAQAAAQPAASNVYAF